MTTKGSRLRNAFITWNNYPTDYLYSIEQLPTHTYICWGFEVGKECGTPHLHIHVEFEKQQSFSTIKKVFPTANIQARKGSPQQATDYCKKDGDFVESGTMSTPGKRTDLDTVREQLAEGDTIRGIVKTATSIQSIRFAEIYLMYHEPQRDWKPKVSWLYGKAGTGKTYRAREEAKAMGFGDDIHTQIKSSKWWQGYDAHTVVILDDIRQEFCSFVEMLGIIDRYPFRIECKGGSRQLLAQHIYITSPVHPEEVWSTNEELNQLLRRIDTIIEVISWTESKIRKCPQEVTELADQQSEASDTTEPSLDQLCRWL